MKDETRRDIEKKGVQIIDLLVMMIDTEATEKDTEKKEIMTTTEHENQGVLRLEEQKMIHTNQHPTRLKQIPTQKMQILNLRSQLMPPMQSKERLAVFIFLPFD